MVLELCVLLWIVGRLRRRRARCLTPLHFRRLSGQSLGLYSHLIMVLSSKQLDFTVVGLIRGLMLPWLDFMYRKFTKRPTRACHVPIEEVDIREFDGFQSLVVQPNSISSSRILIS
jgi:hypothetical protein